MIRFASSPSRGPNDELKMKKRTSRITSRGPEDLFAAEESVDATDSVPILTDKNHFISSFKVC